MSWCGRGECSLAQVVDTLTGWPDGSPRRVSINSFGFGGTNAHVVMETLSEYISRESKDNYPSPQRYKQEDKEFSPHDRVFCVTARSQNSLSGALDALLQHILPMTGEHDDEMLASLAYTLGCRRSHLPWRWAVSVPTMEQLAINLKDNRPLIERARSTSTVAFAFTGQGAQWHGMGRELMERYPVFKNSMRETDEILTSIGAPWSLCRAQTPSQLLNSSLTVVQKSFMTQKSLMISTMLMSRSLPVLRFKLHLSIYSEIGRSPRFQYAATRPGRSPPRIVRGFYQREML